MAAVAHGWRPSRVEGPPVKVAREFNRADVGGPMLRRAARSAALRRRMRHAESVDRDVGGRAAPRRAAAGHGGSP